jgi:predicted ATP-dependent endonuclease of OLD family
LVLIDEPETHLHPQLLATLLTAINSLLEAYDSFSVIATHSAIAVQQVAAKRVHMIRRISETTPDVSSPSIETFGANLTDITREVFDAAENDRDYREALDRLLDAHKGDVEKVKSLFPLGLGLAAEIYLTSQAKIRRGEGD